MNINEKIDVSLKLKPATLSEQFDIGANEKPSRVDYDPHVDANFCPYCGRVLQEATIEHIRCPGCNHLIAWY